MILELSFEKEVPLISPPTYPWPQLFPEEHSHPLIVITNRSGFPSATDERICSNDES